MKCKLVESLMKSHYTLHEKQCQKTMEKEREREGERLCVREKGLRKREWEYSHQCPRLKEIYLRGSKKEREREGGILSFWKSKKEGERDVVLVRKREKENVQGKESSNQRPASKWVVFLNLCVFVNGRERERERKKELERDLGTLLLQ